MIARSGAVYGEATLAFMEAVLVFMEGKLPFTEAMLPLMPAMLLFIEATLPFMEAMRCHLWGITPCGASFAAASGICLRACDAMSGTGLAYGSVCLRACYAMSGTDIAYGAMVQRARLSRDDAGPGTALRYLLRHAQYWDICHLLCHTQYCDAIRSTVTWATSGMPYASHSTASAMPYASRSTKAGRGVPAGHLRPRDCTASLRRFLPQGSLFKPPPQKQKIEKNS
eukprot:3617247-Rhodomonas_salina.1